MSPHSEHSLTIYRQRENVAFCSYSISDWLPGRLLDFYCNNNSRVLIFSMNSMTGTGWTIDIPYQIVSQWDGHLGHAFKGNIKYFQSFLHQGFEQSHLIRFNDCLWGRHKQTNHNYALCYRMLGCHWPTEIMLSADWLLGLTPFTLLYLAWDALQATDSPGIININLNLCSPSTTSLFLSRTQFWSEY